MALVEQLRDDSWWVARTAGYHMAPVFTIMHQPFPCQIVCAVHVIPLQKRPTEGFSTGIYHYSLTLSLPNSLCCSCHSFAKASHRGI